MRCSVSGYHGLATFLQWGVDSVDRVIAIVQWDDGTPMVVSGTDVRVIPDEPANGWQTGAPPKEGAYLVTMDDGTVESRTWKINYANYWCYVTAWKPLPEPYKG